MLNIGRPRPILDLHARILWINFSELKSFNSSVVSVPTCFTHRYSPTHYMAQQKNPLWNPAWYGAYSRGKGQNWFASIHLGQLYQQELKSVMNKGLHPTHACNFILDSEQYRIKGALKLTLWHYIMHAQNNIQDWRYMWQWVTTVENDLIQLEVKCSAWVAHPCSWSSHIGGIHHPEPPCFLKGHKFRSEMSWMVI
jgi:hypothetical protein